MQKAFKQLIVFSLLSLPVHAYAQPGYLDVSFGTEGKVVTDIGEFSEVNSLVVQPNGKILAAGPGIVPPYNDNITVCRYNSNGSPDHGFGSGGMVSIDLGSNYDWVTGMKLQPDGKIVLSVIDYLTNDPTLARLNPDGSPDNTFSGDGIARFHMPHIGFAEDLALQPDGKIIVLARSSSQVSTLRFNANGIIDNTYNGTGYSDFSFSSVVYPERVLLQSDGKILVSGSTESSWGAVQTIVCRYKPDGTHDNYFGTLGKVLLGEPICSDTYLRNGAMALQQDGKILLGGCIMKCDPYLNHITRLNPNGAIDLSYGTSGNFICEGSTKITDMIVQPDGKTLAAGYYSYTIPGTGSHYKYTLIRVDQYGKIETTVDPEGLIALDFGDGKAGACALQPDGKILVAGSTYPTGEESTFGIMRFNANANEQTSPAFTVYPNPFTDLVNIACDKILSNAELWIVDVTGRKTLVQQGLNAARFMIDLSKYPRGVYILELVEGDTRYIQKLIKK